TWIGGGTSIPRAENPFYWESPDGGRVLLWISYHGYLEAIFYYHLVDLNRAYNTLSRILPQWEEEGYPFDAILIMNGSGDNGGTNLNMTELAREWNNTYNNPRWIIAQPEEFFEHLTETYGDPFLSYSGDWAGLWDAISINTPQSTTMSRRTHDLALCAEKISSVNSLAGIDGYPQRKFLTVCENLLQFDEHSGGGAPWPNYMTPEEARLQNQIAYHFADKAFSDTEEQLNQGLTTLVGEIATPQNSIVIFNPLSWRRDDLVEVSLPQAPQFDFRLIDVETGRVEPHQVDEENNRLFFVAHNVPPVGYRRYRIAPLVGGTAVDEESVKLTAKSNVLENDFYRIEVAESDGHLTSIYDKLNSRELVNSSSEFQFNGAIKATNEETWYGVYHPVPTGVTNLNLTLDGPVLKCLTITREGSPFVGVELRLYGQLQRFDIHNYMHRSLMEWVPYEDGFVFYGYTFPFDFPQFGVRFELANTFVDPTSDYLPGAFRAHFPIQHGGEIIAGSHGGVIWANREAFVHEFDGFQVYATQFSPEEATLTSRILKKTDEAMYLGGQIGPVEVEPGASKLYVHRYSFTTHTGAFDPVRTAHFTWEFSNPLIAKAVRPNPDGIFQEPALSFFDLEEPNVMLVCVKKAELGDGFIFRLVELQGTGTTVHLNSPVFVPVSAEVANNLEESIGSACIEENTVIASIGPHETLTLRVRFTDLRLSRMTAAPPAKLLLGGNYPNPFNSTTVISFSIESPVAEAVVTTIEVFNTRGRLIATLLEEPLKPGQHQVIWEGRNRGGEEVSSGVYFCRFHVGESEQIHKMVLLR
ncbi:MAG: glycosyl hydrolase-related protein, partial [Candidatus Zixiibacteriota bacterium]